MEQGNLTESLDIRVVVLVAGQDFGRCPLAARLPAALWPVMGRSALERLLDHLADEGVKRVTLCSEAEMSDSIGPIREGALEVQCVTEDLTGGTAGCLRDAVGADPGELMLVFSASMVSPPPVKTLIEGHLSRGAELTMVFNPPMSDKDSCGTPAEIYICSPGVLEHIPSDGYSDIKEGLIPRIIKAGQTVQPMVLSEPVGNFHDREAYLDAIAAFLEQGRSLPEGYALNGADAPVDASARICGPVAIAQDAQVLAGAVVIGPSVIGAEAIVGQGCTLVRSTLWDRVRVERNSKIFESMVDCDATVGRGALVSRETVSSNARGMSTARSMKTTPLPRVRVGEHSSGWSPGQVIHWVGGLALVSAFLWSYWPTLMDLSRVWRVSDEYSAGLLVPFLAIYVLWSRREEIATVPIRPALLSGAAVFLLAQIGRGLGLYFMYRSAERLSLVLSLAAIVVLIFGWRFLKKLSPIMLFLLLMLPWPNRVQGAVALPLQGYATNSAVWCLELAGYEVVQDGNIIRIGDTSVAVAEACNGLRMITAFFVISGLVVLLAKRAWWEKLIVLLSSLPIALLCNTIRLTITAMFFTVLEGENWEQLFHDFGGYAMMPLALTMMVGELWLLALLTVPPAEIEPEIIMRRGPEHVPDS